MQAMWNLWKLVLINFTTQILAFLFKILLFLALGYTRNEFGKATSPQRKPMSRGLKTEGIWGTGAAEGRLVWLKHGEG